MRWLRLPPFLRLRALFWVAFFLLVLGGAATLGGMLAYVENGGPVEELEYYEPEATTLVYDGQAKFVVNEQGNLVERDGKMPLAEFSAERRYPLTYKQMQESTPHLINAFLAIEDKRFYEHPGVDPIGILRALKNNFLAGHVVEGASTITMQLCGNVLQKIDRSDISLNRKVNEALFSLRVEQRYTKEQIIEFYLNQIYLGGGAYGVEAAAQTYFGKSVNELSLAECAMLGGLPQSPSQKNPGVNLAVAEARRNEVLRAMLNSGYISRSEYDTARNEPTKLVQRRSDTLYKAPYFISYMCDTLRDTEQFRTLARADNPKQDEMAFFRTGGFKVVTTLDLTLQGIAEECMREGLKAAELQWHANKSKRMANDPEESSRPQVGQERIGRIVEINDESIVLEVRGYEGTLPRPAVPPFYNPEKILQEGELLDCRVTSVNADKGTFTGTILPDNKIKGGMVVLEGSGQHAGRVLAMVGGDDFFDKNEKKAEWNFATQGRRPPGSGIKPLFYAAAVRNGAKPDQRYENSPFPIGDYLAKNYSTNYQHGMMTIHEGLERSQNVMMLRVFSDSRLGTMKDKMNFVGECDFAWSQRRWNDIEKGGAATCLGTFDVTPLELAAAYTIFSNEGVGVRPYAVEKILNRKNEVVYSAAPQKKIILSPQQAYAMVSMMRGVFSKRGTARDLGEHFSKMENVPEMAGKTGTTDEVRDAWFNGYTPDLVVSISIGYDPRRPLGGKMTGSTLAGPIYQNFMDRVLALPDRKWKMTFPIPPGVYKRVVDLNSGVALPEGQQIEDSETEAEMWFIQENNQPQ